MDIFNNLRSTIKIKDVQVDNEVFQLHYRVTALLLLGCAALVASKQHFGDPIDCITRDDVPNQIMDTYCWIHATFTLSDACNKTVGIEVAHPCVDKNQPNENRVYHYYYQWVYFVLFFQAACFYAPHQFWKAYESELLKKLTDTLKDPLFKMDESKEKQYIGVVTYLIRHKNKHQNYFRYFILCEVLNFVNVIFQIYLVDHFLGGTFTTYGLDVLNYIKMDQDERVDPMVRVFPRMTKCTFHRFGSSGDVQRHDALCILPLNIINEKIYVIMWFWFVFLAIITGLWLIFRLLTITQPQIRHRLIARRATMVNNECLESVLFKLNTGDWFLLFMLSKNIDAVWFRAIMNDIEKGKIPSKGNKVTNAIQDV